MVTEVSVLSRTNAWWGEASHVYVSSHSFDLPADCPAILNWEAAYVLSEADILSCLLEKP